MGAACCRKEIQGWAQAALIACSQNLRHHPHPCPVCLTSCDAASQNVHLVSFLGNLERPLFTRSQAVECFVVTGDFELPMRSSPVSRDAPTAMWWAYTPCRNPSQSRKASWRSRPAGEGRRREFLQKAELGLQSKRHAGESDSEIVGGPAWSGPGWRRRQAHEAPEQGSRASSASLPGSDGMVDRTCVTAGDQPGGL